jgi:hypothetical protein
VNLLLFTGDSLVCLNRCIRFRTQLIAKKARTRRFSASDAFGHVDSYDDKLTLVFAGFGHAGRRKVFDDIVDIIL